MKLYEINLAIARLADQIECDPETGELLGDSEELYEQINALQMERSSVLEYLAKLVLNIRAEAAAIKAEEERLSKRRAVLEKKEDRIMQILDRECAGQTTNCGVATIRYRNSSRLTVTDAFKAISWLKRHKYSDCYRVPAPEVNKSNVRKLINSGTKVPGCEITPNQTCSLK